MAQSTVSGLYGLVGRMHTLRALWHNDGHLCAGEIGAQLSEGHFTQVSLVPSMLVPTRDHARGTISPTPYWSAVVRPRPSLWLNA